MKKQLAIISLFLALNAGNALAQHVRVRGYVRHSTGTYVMPHYRTAPDHSRLDNWSTRGNYNPFMGKRGSTEPMRSYRRRK